MDELLSPPSTLRISSPSLPPPRPAAAFNPRHRRHEHRARQNHDPSKHIMQDRAQARELLDPGVERS